MNEAMANPYRLGFMLATLEEIKTKEDIIVEILSEQFPNFLTELIGSHGAAIFNLWAKKKINSIFKKNPKPKKSQNQSNALWQIPDKDGNMRTVETY